MKFEVVIARPHSGHLHASAFDELALSIHDGLQSLGHVSHLLDGVSYLVQPKDLDAKMIVLGAHLALDKFWHVNPERLVIYNTEQVGNHYFAPELVALYRKCEVWDYSHANAERYEALGLKRPAVVPMGYVPRLRKVPTMLAKPIDVLHFGAPNDRRQTICDGLRRRGWHVQELFGVYGRERDEYLACSKLVINVHFYPEQAIFEQARVCYCVANLVPVVSEKSTLDEGIALAATAPYDAIVHLTDQLLRNPDGLRFAAESAFVTYSATPMSTYLRPVVGEP